MTTVDPSPPTQDSAGTLDNVLSELHRGETAWASTTLGSRAALLSELAASIHQEAENWVTTAAEIKGLERASPLVGEEWLSGPYVMLTTVRTLRKSILAIARGASPIERVRFGEAPGGRLTIPVLPDTVHETLLFHGFRADVWLKPGVTRLEAERLSGLGELTPTETGGIGLVLGAGNITSIPPLDVLHELFAHNRVVILKLNPVMGGMLPVYMAALAPLISRGLLRIVLGGAETGSYLAHHGDIAHVHITGSASTHDAIVWGSGSDAAARRRAATPLLTVPITSELGGVSPVIIVPGDWTASDLRFQAEHVATQRLHNGGYNCIAAQVVILSSDWPQKELFLAELRSVLERAPARRAWYPGSSDRVAGASASYPSAERFGERMLLHEGPDGNRSMLATEYFAPVLGVLELDGTGQAFLDAAVDTANEEITGTLGANILIAPRELAELDDGFEESLARLRYGCIAINAWTGMAFLTAAAPWGAWRGHTIDDVQSGIGVVHNALLLDDTERVVVRGPFRPFPRSLWRGAFSLFPKPPWFVTARSAATTSRLMVEFAATPSWGRLPGVFASAFRA